MKIKIIFFTFVTMLAFAPLAESGAAVAMRNKPKGGVKKGQLPPGYRMGPNGIEKIEQAGENESSQEQAAEGAREDETPVEDEVGLEQIVEALQASGKSWELIIHSQDKQAIVEEFIKEYSTQGITIRKPASYYVSFIDEMAKGNLQMLDMPFDRVLQIAAVMEYDFDNGQNKDLLAQKILGPQVYEVNKQRLIKSSGK